MKIEFCKENCCPVIEYSSDSNLVILGDEKGPEGITKWTKNQFADFLAAAKDGKFDEVIRDI